MIFNQCRTSDGQRLPGRWVCKISKNYFYTIVKYSYSKEAGFCEPYYKAYFDPGGQSVDGNEKHKSIERAVKACIKHYNEL